MIDLDFILKSTNGTLLSGDQGQSFTAVSTDSRKVAAEDIFFALKGESFDGHEFVEDALNKGAAGAVIENDTNLSLHNDKIIIKVPSTLEALGSLASSWRRSFPDLKLAAVSGSNGKTTTKEMTWSILSERHNVLKNTGNFNNLIGLPETLLQLNNDHDMSVVELGMNDFGEIRRLTEIACPDVGAITNIGRAHLEKLRGIEGVAKAKSELVESFGPDNIFVVNADDPRIVRIAENTPCQQIRFGINARDLDIRASDIEPEDVSSISFNLNTRDEVLSVRIKGIGLHNVMNAMCASGIALSMGSGLDEIKAGLEGFSPTTMRLQVIETTQGFKLINDAYNANPDSMTSAIDELVRLKGQGRAIAVLGDMLELGEFSEEQHRAIGRYMSQAGIDYAITMGKFGPSILEGAGNGLDGIYAESYDQAGRVLKETAKAGDLVLVKGSRGMRMEEVIKRVL